MNINIYLHINHVFNLFMNETLRTFILWKQVYPKSSLNVNDQYYLLIIGSQHDILCVLFESGGCTLTIQQAESIGDQQQQIGKYRQAWIHRCGYDGLGENPNKLVMSHFYRLFKSIDSEWRVIQNFFIIDNMLTRYATF